jgi:hypothetical protein
LGYAEHQRGRRSQQVQRIVQNTPFSEKSANYLEESKEFPIFAA